MIDKIIGVLDVLDSCAVHAIAGDRRNYQPMPWCNGSPTELVDHYHRLGVNRTYVADLDAILHGQVQTQTLIDVCNRKPHEEILLDVGWKGDCPHQLQAVNDVLHNTNASVGFIAATESASGIAAVGQLADVVGASRVFLSLDFRDGNLVGDGTSESRWIEAAMEFALGGIIVLDVAQVGTGRGPITAVRCQRLADRCRGQRIYSGGGIRSLDDVETLVRAGCHGCLVGTMLHENRFRENNDLPG
ncbi:1-(5-phosphoribosyl)-5-[(5-phosphoribosylamino)methylideneamino] imidazole-4-carboxamide isomerase [Rubripirellula tenax]|uniref:1-(5-phosphoribosyl)-5-[(5-phosphoribosylamino)methylideneamino] imidazole-4-carboxamide isomerase n=1 Tax=Rubripirellula tenax TaxID=2528015 RepID=A0A5C6EFX4_9BACT|nr:HisA/HisF-related TIM barrel protein [Rubripirellula tenax]TWU47415.1 1-(5-phosphoribosyl)-5-[(5-phosphoribosylamino)methylideneamino] imidazole-4-carboxamide isomerase [Rubripirellula tenax]